MMMRKDVSIEVVQGDIANQDEVEAVVNAANAQLTTGGGVAGAIHRAAGPELYKECKKLAPLKTGEAVITSAYNLPNKFVIHCVGPVYGSDSSPDMLLKKCYHNCLKLAERNNLSSIAFPAISTGIYGFPPHRAVKLVHKVILDESLKFQYIKKIKFVLFSQEDLRLYQEEFNLPDQI